MKFNSPKELIDKISRWFNGLIALPLLAVAYGYLEIFSGRISPLIVTGIYVKAIIIVLIFMLVLAATFRYRKHIRAIPKDNDLIARLEEYADLSKNYYLFIFALAMTTTLGMYITASTSFAGLYAFQLFVLSVHRPSLLSIANTLNLKDDVRANFLKKNIFG